MLLRLAEKAFRPGRFPFPLLHIDTGHNFPEVIDVPRRARRRARRAADRALGRGLDRAAARSRLREPSSTRATRAQSVTLLEAIEEFGFDALIGGARRDEEKARAKERIFSFRDSFGQWDPKNQRPELWDLYNARVHPGEHMRVFPISNWTELDVWQYIARERLAAAVALLRAPARGRAARRPAGAGDAAHAAARRRERSRRCRCASAPSATSPAPARWRATPRRSKQIIAETAVAEITERGATRMDDQTSEASMERRKREGYF